MAGSGRFDVAVVGGGAAGCVVAARMAAAGSGSVILLEAGPDFRAKAPPELSDGWHLSRDFDWGFRSEPDEHRAAEPIRRVRLLGGTSWLTRFAMRGSPGDYDEWAAIGNAGWGGDDVLRFFRDLETDLVFGDEPWHGAGGPLPVTRYRDLARADAHAALLLAAEAAGFPPVDDHNAPGAVGVGPMPMSSVDGRRVTTLTAYLGEPDMPANLTIRPDAQVADVTFVGARATGVRLLDGSVIDADRVVLCAGTYGSPTILLRSGIGPAADLRAVGVPARVDLAGVGVNLQDHPGVDLDPGYRGGHRAAPLLHSAATFHSQQARSTGPPDLMFWLADPFPPENPPQLGIGIVLLKPRSTGRVRLRSLDPADPPRIELPGVRESADIERLIEGYRRAFEVAADPVVRRHCEEPLPDSPSKRAGLERLVRAEAYSVPHVVGTCAMGPDPSRGAVVDAGGRVHGTDGLFVVDASIMPTVPSGFTHLPTIMLAEKLAASLAGVANGTPSDRA